MLLIIQKIEMRMKIKIRHTKKIKKAFLGVVHCESLLSLFYSVEALNEGLNMQISMIAVYTVKCYVFES